LLPRWLIGRDFQGKVKGYHPFSGVAHGRQNTNRRHREGAADKPTPFRGGANIFADPPSVQVDPSRGPKDLELNCVDFFFARQVVKVRSRLALRGLERRDDQLRVDGFGGFGPGYNAWIGTSVSRLGFCVVIGADDDLA
jgi:hypothetical protein